MWRYHVKYRVAGLIPDPLGYWFDPDVTDGSGIRPKPVAHMWRYHVKYRVAGLIPDPVYRQDIDSRINCCLSDKQDLGSVSEESN